MEIEIEQRRPRRIASALTTVLTVVVTLAGVAFILPAVFGMQRYVITGTSMTGTIDYGSVAVEDVVPVSDLRVGDIITYEPPADSGLDHLVTHRIVAIHGHTFRTQGDAVPQRDPWKFQLDGVQQSRVAFSVPYVGYPFIWLADRGTRMLVIGLPAALIALISLWQIASVLRPRRKVEPSPPSHSSVPVRG